MLSVAVLAISFIWTAQCGYLQFYEHADVSHFRPIPEQKIGASNVPDIIARLLRLGVFVKAYTPPAFLTFPRAPKGNLFVYVPHYTGAPLNQSAVSFNVDGYAKVSDILAGSKTHAPVSALPDIVSAHFTQKKTICASGCAHLAQMICGSQTDIVVAKEPKEIDPIFMENFNVPQDMPKEFVLEMQYLLSTPQNGKIAIFFGVSSFKKVPQNHLKDAKRILVDVISQVLKTLPDNSVAQVLSMAPSSQLPNRIHSASNRRLLQTTASPNSGSTFVYLPGEFLAQIWVSVGGLFVVIAVAYYLAFMDYTQDSVLYTTMNPNLAERRR